MKGVLSKIIRGAAVLAILGAASACSNGAGNPLAPGTPALRPGNASLSTLPGVVLPPRGGEGETLGNILGWP